MAKTILITGSTSGIGLEAAKSLAESGHRVLLHGRSEAKLEQAAAEVQTSSDSSDSGSTVSTYTADLSLMRGVEELAQAVLAADITVDVLINNAGILKSLDSTTAEGLDLRLAVNTFAPALLTHRLAPVLAADARVVNLSSAAQAPVDLEALSGASPISEQFNAYAQSKLALTMWSRVMSRQAAQAGRIFVAVNPGSLLATRMVQEGFGLEGKDVSIGSKILVAAALSDEFASASGRYFDNDSGQFSAPHEDALNDTLCAAVVERIEETLARLGNPIT